MKRYIAATLVFCATCIGLAAQSTSVLEDEYERTKSAFTAGGGWFSYPDYADRDGWNTFFAGAEADVVAAGEHYLGFRWNSIPASAYIAYDRSGDRAPMELRMKENRVALNALLLAELAEGKGRFLPDLIDGVWQFCQYPGWVLSAHQFRQPSRKALPNPGYRFIDLNSGAVGVQMAVTWHFFHKAFDSLDPSISVAIEDAVEKNILDPYLDAAKQESNWWLGFKLKKGMVVNNWNPWCNSDALLCFLLMEKDQTKLEAALAQGVRSVDIFLDYIKEDGACEEGPAYWGHSAGKLFDFISTLHAASLGAFDVFGNPRIKAMGEYIAASYVGDGWVVNFADATARLELPFTLIYNYGKAVDSRAMEDFALYLLADNDSGKFSTPLSRAYTSLHKTLNANGIAKTTNTVVDELIDLRRLMSTFSVLPEMTEKVAGLNKSAVSDEAFEKEKKQLRSSSSDFVWYPQTQFCYMKNGTDWFLACKGGHNNESHNHNDIGTFILYVSGVPMFIDAGVGTYTAKTFGPDRYSIWSMQSLWHNLPEINGTAQQFGGQFKAADVKASRGKFSLELSGAYPEESSCSSWTRSYSLTDKKLTITDSWSLSERNAPDVERFLVQGEVFTEGSAFDGHKVGKGELIVRNGSVAVKLSFPKTLTPAVETKELDDPRMTAVWGTEIRRISLTSPQNAPLSGKYVFTVTRIR